jgi:hypothetical protein
VSILFLEIRSFPYHPRAFCTKLEDDLMSDDKDKRGAEDRRMVAGDEPYEVGYEAEKLGITPEQLKAIIVRVGVDRSKIEAAASRIKR